MRKSLLVGILMLAMLVPLLTLSAQVAFAEPDIAPGELTHVYKSGGILAPSTVPGGDGLRWIVVPGQSYYVHLTGVELSDGTTTVWIKGTTNTGVAWTIKLEDQVVSGGEITTDLFQIPSNAGCTIVVAYWKAGHLAHDPIKPEMPGHMKTYYDDEEPYDNPIPCEPVGAPEFPFASAMVVSLGLLAMLAVRRRQKRP